MAVANGNGTQQAAPVLAAFSAMRDGTREQKQQANEFLSQFQKSVRCYQIREH